MFSNKNKKYKVYSCKPRFYYIKVGFKGVKIILACFGDKNTATNKEDADLTVQMHSLI